MPYRFDTPNCPKCSEPPDGTVEAVSGLAELMPLGHGFFEYTGHTKINWDGQRTIARDGQILLECGQGHLWWSGRREIP
jgi:hypothetical protein